MMKKIISFNFLFILFLTLSLSSIAFAQTVFEPINSNVYDFLDRMAQKGVVQFSDVVRPVSRMYIAKKLLEVREAGRGEVGSREYGVGSRKKGSRLSEVEKEDLEFYLKDFGFEVKTILRSANASRGDVGMRSANANGGNDGMRSANANGGDDGMRSANADGGNDGMRSANANGGNDGMRSANADSGDDVRSANANGDDGLHSANAYGNDSQPVTTLINWDPYGRWRLFSYEDTLFQINADPILGYQAGKRDGAKYSHSWNGVALYGYVAGRIGFSLSFNDNSETGTTIDRTKNFTPVTGVSITKYDNNNIQYDQVEANIATNWSWGDVAIGKDFLNWGYGRSGLLVLSDKAPSFPYIRLDLHPVKWLHFNYIHAWLNSNVIDSTSEYATLLKGNSRTIFRDKYFVSHSITVTPEDGLDLSIGESMIYADKLEIPYLIPIMFFRLADHYLSQNDNNAGGNASLFFGVSSRNQLKNTHLYGTLFIDEFTIENLFNSQQQHMQIGFTLGGSVTDLPIENLTLTAEFTKIYPGTYTHYIPTLTYQSSGYSIGDWMGTDADRVYGAIDYRFIRGLQATIWGQYVRKGAAATADEQYNNPQPPFLFGLRTNYAYVGADLSYEITNDFSAKVQFQTTNISTEQSDLSYVSQRRNEFYVSLEYGLTR